MTGYGSGRLPIRAEEHGREGSMLPGPGTLLTLLAVSHPQLHLRPGPEDIPHAVAGLWGCGQEGIAGPAREIFRIYEHSWL